MHDFKIAKLSWKWRWNSWYMNICTFIDASAINIFIQHYAATSCNINIVGTSILLKHQYCRNINIVETHVSDAARLSPICNSLVPAILPTCLALIDFSFLRAIHQDVAKYHQWISDVALWRVNSGIGFDGMGWKSPGGVSYTLSSSPNLDWSWCKRTNFNDNSWGWSQ